MLYVAGGFSSWANGAIARRIGPRLELVVSYGLLLASAAAWTLLPDAAAPAALAVAWIAVFSVLGVAKAMNETATLHYAVSSVEPRLVVSASLVLYLATGLLAGVAGIALTALLMGRAFAPNGGIPRRASGAVLGAVVFRLVYALALRLNMPAFMLKLVSSVIVIGAIAGPYMKARYPELHRRLSHKYGKGGGARA